LVQPYDGSVAEGERFSYLVGEVAPGVRELRVETRSRSSAVATAGAFFVATWPRGEASTLRVTQVDGKDIVCKVVADGEFVDIDCD